MDHDNRTASPLVSTITVVRNGERYLREALQSIMAQTRLPDEIIVVDDQSTDDTAKIAKSFKGVRYLWKNGLGLAQVRNFGLAAATGDIIAFLDHDDRWMQKKLEIQVSYLQRHPEIFYTISHMRWFSEGDYPHHRLHKQYRFTQGEIGMAPGTLVARRETFDIVGGFDPTLTIACDQDWFVRSQDKKIRFAVIPEVLFEKRLHEHNLSAQIETLRAEWLQILHRSLSRKRQ